jgi:hypothetical protein
MELLTVILVLLGSFGFFTLLITVSTWSVHKSMVIAERVEWDYGTFDRFLVEFNKKKWWKNPSYPESFFGVGEFGKDYVHAGIIKFDGQGMILDYISYIRYLLWQNQFKSGVNFRRKGIWK